MKRRGFLKFLAAAPIALAVPPPKKVREIVISPPRISEEEIKRAYEEMLDKMQVNLISEIQAEEDRIFLGRRSIKGV